MSHDALARLFSFHSGEEPGSLREAIVLKRSYAHADFEADYNSFKGNAYGGQFCNLALLSLQIRGTAAQCSTSSDLR